MFLYKFTFSYLLIYHRDSIKGALLQAIVYAVAQSMTYYIFAAGFRLAAYLVTEGRADYEDIYRLVEVSVVTKSMQVYVVQSCS